MAPYEFDPSFPLIQRRQKLLKQVSQLDAALSSREKNLAENEILARQGLVPNASENDVKSNLSSFLPPWLSPGNLGDLNKVIWPFWFTFTAPELVPNSNSTGIITVTQEAAFVLMAMTKVVFEKNPLTNEVEAIDASDFSSAGQSQNLSFSIQDAQSKRFFTQVPIQLDTIGVPQFPTTLPSPLMFLPNSTVQISYFNADPSRTYIPFVTFFGYRVRIDDAQNILSTITG